MPVEAAEAYENAFRNARDSLSLDDYLEAAVLYFTCTDFGYVSYKHLPDEFAGAAFARARSWLERALLQFGEYAEVRFWALYLGFVVLGEPPFVDECRRLVETGESSTPYFYLYSSTRDQLYRAKAEELYLTVRIGNTAKQRYIRSILAPLFRD
jgi:hypothetical protein